MSNLSSSRVEIVLMVKIVIRKVEMLNIFPVGQILKKQTLGLFCSFLWHVYFVCIYTREPNKSCVSPSRGGKGGLGCCRPVKIPKDCSHLLNFESSEKVKARYNITSFNESEMKRYADL